MERFFLGRRVKFFERALSEPEFHGGVLRVDPAGTKDRIEYGVLGREDPHIENDK